MNVKMSEAEEFWAWAEARRVALNASKADVSRAAGRPAEWYAQKSHARRRPHASTRRAIEGALKTLPRRAPADTFLIDFEERRVAAGVSPTELSRAAGRSDAWYRVIRAYDRPPRSTTMATMEQALKVAAAANAGRQRHPFWDEFDERRKDAGVTQAALSVAAGRCHNWFASMRRSGGEPRPETRRLLDTALSLATDGTKRRFTGTITGDSEGEGAGVFSLLNLDTGEFDLDVCLPFDVSWPVGATVRVTVERVWPASAGSGRGSE